jgi:hypothetical protein
MFRVFTSTDNAEGYPVKETVHWFDTYQAAQYVASWKPDWFIEYDSDYKRDNEALHAMRQQAYFS